MNKSDYKVMKSQV